MSKGNFLSPLSEQERIHNKLSPAGAMIPVRRQTTDSRQTIDSSMRIKRRSVPGEVGAVRASLTTHVKDSDLRDALEEAYKEIDQIQANLDNAVGELGSLYSTDQFRQPDDRIARSRDELRGDIRDWSKNFHYISRKSGLAKLFPLTITQQDRPYHNVSHVFDKYLDEDIAYGHSLLLQSCIWNTLYDEVFGEMVWSGGCCCRKSGIKASKCPVYESFWGLHEITISMSHPRYLLTSY
jgi:hypothetical protein